MHDQSDSLSDSLDSPPVSLIVDSANTGCRDNKCRTEIRKTRGRAIVVAGESSFPGNRFQDCCRAAPFMALYTVSIVRPAFPCRRMPQTPRNPQGGGQAPVGQEFISQSPVPLPGSSASTHWQRTKRLAQTRFRPGAWHRSVRAHGAGPFRSAPRVRARGQHLLSSEGKGRPHGPFATGPGSRTVSAIGARKCQTLAIVPIPTSCHAFGVEADCI